MYDAALHFSMMASYILCIAGDALFFTLTVRMFNLLESSKLFIVAVITASLSASITVFTITLKILLVLGLLTFSIFFFGARIIVNALNNPNAYYSMVALAPALLFVPIMAAYRGYFQGRNNMTPTAVSQIIEQSARVGFGLILAYFLMPKGLDYAAAGGSFGATAGAIFGMAFILFVYYINKPKIEKELLEKSWHLYPV